LRKQFALEVKLLDDGFNNPIGVSDFRKIVVEIASGGQTGERVLRKTRRAWICARLRVSGGDLAAGAGLESDAKFGATISSRTVATPAFARCAAMRLPMVPAPRNGNFLNRLHASLVS